MNFKMKLLIAVFLTLVSTSKANPRTYQYVPTAQFHDNSEHHRHPETPSHENMYSRLLNGKVNEAELTSEYWLNNAKAFVDEQLKKTPNEKKAKNIIMFMADGMSHPTITASRVYIGSEEKKLAFENFPYTASAKTYCVDAQIGDSACTITALLSGIKTNDAMIGLSGKAKRLSCTDGNDLSKRVESIAAWAIKEGKEAGFVTNTRVTHPSPGGLFAHITERDWENDVEVTNSGCNAATVDDMAEQLVYSEVGSQLKVMFGGGSRNFIDKSMSEHGMPGSRNDRKNLIDEWRAVDPERVYVNSKQALNNLSSDVYQVLGLFSSNHLSYNLDVQRDGLQDLEPSLAELTLKGIDILSQNDDGYFLFVEGGRIDHGHHQNKAKYAVDETVEFSKAIEAALKTIDLEETLVVVTSDHGHVMTLAGYAARGNDIFGFGGTGQDNIPYMTLSYANGRGFYNHTKATGGRVDARTLDLTSNDFRFPATVPLDFESHGGEDVGVWAVGPWAHLFEGTMEQNVIPHIMAYASCIGHGLKMCDSRK